jgi:dipeptidyl aminopeptidase/acylaminoacyl peptidase
LLASFDFATERDMQPITSDDIYRHRTLGPLHATVGSDRCLVSESQASKKKDGYRTRVWLWSPQGRSKILGADKQASSPKLSNDGTRVAYLSSDKQGNKQVMVLELEREQERTLGEPSSEWQTIQGWSPDGRRLLLTRKIPWAEDEFDDLDADSRKRPIVVVHLPYKQDGGGHRAGYRTQLEELDVTTGTRSVLVHGDFDVQSAQWSPDGARLFFIRGRSGQQRHFSDVWVAHADGSEAVQRTHDLPGVNSATWSPDGKRLAVAAGAIEGDSITYLYVLDADKGPPRRATELELHLESAEPVWHPNGDRIAVVAAVRGLHRLAIVGVANGEVTLLRSGLHHVLAMRATSTGLAFVSATMRKPCEFFRCDWDGGNEQRLSSFNRSWSRQRLRPHVAKRAFRVPDGRGGEEAAEAWILTPPHLPPPWPVFMDMHGGPHSAVLIDFSNHMYWYHLVALGWMVVAPNAAGSNSYGDEFACRLRGRWGELDLPQFLTILGTLRAEGRAGDAAACGGKSYGGFLAAYAAGHCDAFDRIVVSAPVADIESHFGTSDSGYYVSPYAMKAEIEQARDRYHELSPLQDIARTRAPVLLLQGAKDQRCPLDQSEELMAALVRAGKPSKMVVYPGGSHSMAASGKPSHRADYHLRFARWVNDAVGGSAEDIPGGATAKDRGARSRVPADNMKETGALVRQVGPRGSST